MLKKIFVSIFIAVSNCCKNIDVEELFKVGFGFSLSKKEIELYNLRNIISNIIGTERLIYKYNNTNC